MFSRLAVVVAASVVLGCGSQRAEIDSLVEEVWIEINQDQQVDAVEYLANGGRHYDPGLPPQPDDLDRTVILPLMKRLKDEYKAQPWAHVQPEEGDYAWTFCVRLPAGGAARSGVAQAVRDADDRFDGQIEAMWGNRWLVLFFGDQQDAAEH